MPTDLPRLVKAILSRVRERGGYVNKTKLVKYLYLLDLEHYRRTGQLLTGFNWRFYLYGPWTDEFEGLYQTLRASNEITVRPGREQDIDAEYVATEEFVDLNDVIPDFATESRRVVDQWADRHLGPMLDYVYFHTEPMEGATRGDPLDFTRVDRAPRASGILPTPSPDLQAMRVMRQRIAERKAARAQPPPHHFTPPPYNEDYFEALRRMDQDEGY